MSVEDVSVNSSLSDFETDDDLRRWDCRETHRHLRYVNEVTEETGTYRCGQWNCVCCGYHMKMNFLEAVDELVVRRPEMSRMLTLTVDPSRYPSNELAHKDLGRAWNQLRTEITQRYGRFSYVWVREEQDSGNPHLHVIVSRYLPWQWVQSAWDRIGAGSVVDIRKVNTRKAGHYLAKYLAKDAMAGLPAGVHRFGSSSDIDLGVRGGTDSQPNWDLLAWDPVVYTWLEPDGGDFRPDPDRPPPPD